MFFDFLRTKFNNRTQNFSKKFEIFLNFLNPLNGRISKTPFHEEILINYFTEIVNKEERLVKA